MITEYRTTRGYGVHSPFAFNFITEVLRNTTPYYAYAEIAASEESVKRDNKSFVKWLCLLFRIAMYFECGNLIFMPCATAKYSAVNEIIRSNINAVTSRIKLFVVDDCGTFSEDECQNLLKQMESEKEFIVCLNIKGCSPHLMLRMERMLHNRSYGMCFLNKKRILVAALLTHLPKLDYKLYFR